MAEYDNPSIQKSRGEAAQNAASHIPIAGFQHVTFVSWRSVLAGFFISMLCFTILLSLGMGIGGVSFEPNSSGTAWTWSSALWIIVSALIALFVGSYIAGRISNYITMRIGAAQG